MRTLYDLLGVRREASLAELERAYRHQLEESMRAGRPSLGRKGQRRLRALREAFLLLASPSERSVYDQQLAVRAQRRARVLRNGATLVSAGLVILGFALIGGGWYQYENQYEGTHAKSAAATSAVRGK